jgi:nucleoside-diphosphate-sugar epimerase
MPVGIAECQGWTMRVLLTGSSGWLGRFLAPRLRTAGHVVIGLDVAPGADTDVVGSVADRAAVDRAFAVGVDAVIHAGALHKPDITRYPAKAFVDVNVAGTLHLLEAAKSAGHDRFVFTSTTSSCSTGRNPKHVSQIRSPGSGRECN